MLVGSGGAICFCLFIFCLLTKVLDSGAFIMRGVGSLKFISKHGVCACAISEVVTVCLEPSLVCHRRAAVEGIHGIDALAAFAGERGDEGYILGISSRNDFFYTIVGAIGYGGGVDCGHILTA